MCASLLAPLSAAAAAPPPPAQAGATPTTAGSAGPVPPDTTKAHKTDKAPAPFLQAQADTSGQAYSATVAGTFDVNDSGDTHDADVGDGLCADASGLCTLRAAIEEADASGSNTYRIFVPSMTIALSNGPLSVDNSMLIEGAGQAATVVSGGGTDRVFEIDGVDDVRISNLTVADGSVDGDGAGMDITDAGMTVANVTFDSNSATGSGGGLFADSATQLWVSGSTFRANEADYGGGLYTDGASFVSGSTFGGPTPADGNSASTDGGGAYFDESSTVENSTFSYNTAGDYGGGAYGDYPVVVTNSGFDHNAADSYGGGYAIGDYTSIFYGSTFVGNVAEYGGGIYNDYVAELVDSQVNDNTGTYEGGGIYNDQTLHVLRGQISRNAAGDSTGYAYGGGVSNEGDLATLDGVLLDANLLHGSMVDPYYAEGGAIYSDYYLQVSNSTISNTAAAGYQIYGGAVAADNGINTTNVSVLGTTVNAVDYVEGGAVYNDSYSSASNLVIDQTNVTVTGDGGYIEGGALYPYYLSLDGGRITRTTSTSSGDGGYIQGGAVYGYFPGAWHGVIVDGTNATADSYVEGAGLYIDDHTSMRNVAITNNHGTVTSATNADDSVGGAYVDYASDLTNLTVAGNSITMPATATPVAVGGVLLYDDANLTNLTIAGNTASGAAATLVGGLWQEVDYVSTIKNSIVAQNSNAQCLLDGTLSSAGHNISSDSSCDFTSVGDQENVDPLLGPLQDNGGSTLTMAPLAGSPAIDTGTPDGAPSDDQRGVARPQGAGFDIGAVEVAGVGNAKIVQFLYRDLLGRTADPAGLAYWTSLLDGGYPAAAVAASIESTTEYRVRVVTGMYEDYLGRDPDVGGRDFWVGVIAAGGTLEQVRAGILGTDEYYTNAGGTDADFVDQLYVDVLHRHVDPDGSTYWTSQISGGMSRTDVAMAVQGTNEAKTILVGGIYDALLRRPADAGGSAYFIGLLDSGHRDEFVTAAIAGSAEYAAYALAH